MLSEESKKVIAAEAVTAEKKAETKKDGQFDNLYQCTEV